MLLVAVVLVNQWLIDVDGQPIPAWPLSDHDGDESSDFEIGSQDGKAAESAALALKMRKKAGLPEMAPDALPSTLVQKCMTLSSTILISLVVV